MHFQTSVIAAMIGLFPICTLAQESQACKIEQAGLRAIETRYKSQYSTIEKRGNDLGNEAPKNGDKINFDVKVDMKEQRWVLKLPSVTITRNEIVLGLPQTTMKQQTWSYDVPRVRMERRKIGQYPEFSCKKDKWGIPYGCKTTWSNIYADVPVTDMVRTEMKLDVPEVTWKNTKISWDVPTLTWVENTWFVKIPEFTLINVAAEKGKDLKEKSDDLNREIAALNASRAADSRSATTALYVCFRQDLTEQQSEAEKQMDEGIASLSSSIQGIRSQGADPTKMPSDSGQAINLVAVLTDMTAKRKETSESFDAARSKFDQAEQAALAQLQ